jgi:lipid-A-disaccharide synthase-like uncharacterized protein
MGIASWIWDGNRFLGVEWHVWKVVGWAGNAIFFSRFFVQWIATEKHKQVIVPMSFWWLSLIGSLLLLIYGIHRRDSVFIFAYAFTWIPYIRNIVIHYRNQAARRRCHTCGTHTMEHATFCHQCGAKLSRSATHVAH